VAGDPRHDLRAAAREKAGLAGGIIIGAAGLGNAIGPLIGGVLTDALSWRWIFFLNVPISTSPCSSRTTWSR
jgi:MFS family permease